MSESEMNDVLQNVKPNVKIETILDDFVLATINITNGALEKVGDPAYPNAGLCPECDHDSNGNISDSTNCTPQGIKQCSFSVYQQWSTPKIVLSSIAGVAQAVMADCYYRNCFGW